MKLTTVKLNGDTIELIDNMVSVKKICENLGLDVPFQRKKTQADETFKSQFKNIEINGITQRVLCIPLNKLDGWLFSISVKPEVKEKLLEYKNECFDVLHKHFNTNATQATDDEVKKLQAIIMAQNKLIAQQPQTKHDIFMNDSMLHNNFLDFLYQANKVTHEVNAIRHLSPGIDSTHQSLSNFMLHITRRYEKIRGADRYKIDRIGLK